MLVLFIGDLHYGERGDSVKYCQQVNDMLIWAKTEAEKRDCKTVVQFGDWFHNRTKVDVQTMGFGIQGAKILQSIGDAYTLVSNHDIYHRDRLDVNSMKILSPYIKVIDAPTVLNGAENVIMWPWVTTTERWDEYLSASKGYDYVLGHFELSGFMMNDNYTMEHGFSAADLKKFKHVYSGHYHSPQQKGNITYLGVPVPHSMNEANRQMGVYFFETTTGDLEFVPYEAVKVISLDYRELSKLDTVDAENTYVRVEFPDSLEDETVITDVQKYLEERNFAEHKIRYTDTKVREILETDVGDIQEVENIDEVVVTFLDDSRTIDGVNKSLLREIYIEAAERGKSSD